MVSKGVAISLYDKFEDLEVLVDILRENFEDDYYIAVCSEHADAEERLKDLDVDEVISSTGIAYNPEMDWQRGVINRTCRILESFKITCKACMEAECEYVMHLHADAWPLDEKRLNDLVSELEASDRKLAVRGPGFAYRSPRFPTGFVMDQFFIFEAEYFSDINFFDFNPMDLMPHVSIHNSLMLLLLGKVQRSNIWFYSDMSDDLYWDGKAKEELSDAVIRVRPSVFDPKWGLVHVATDAFPEKYGKSVQAMYLERFDIDRGNRIPKFIQEHKDDNVIYKLDEIEISMNRKLNLLMYNTESFNRYFNDKEKILGLSYKMKAMHLIGNLAKKIYLKTNSLFFKLPFTDFILSSNQRYFRRSAKDWEMYKGSKWPNEISATYNRNVEKTDFIKTNFWFDEESQDAN